MDKRMKMRVRIAKDVLKILRGNRNIAAFQSAGYVSFTFGGGYRPRHWANQNLPFHTSLLRDAERTRCRVCALGALFLADVDRRNEVSVRQATSVFSREPLLERLSDYFTRDELCDIECVFEAVSYDYARCDKDGVPRDVMRLRPRMWKAVEGRFDTFRLVGMMEHLIENEGRLV